MPEFSMHELYRLSWHFTRSTSTYLLWLTSMSYNMYNIYYKGVVRDRPEASTSTNF